MPTGWIEQPTSPLRVARSTTELSGLVISRCVTVYNPPNRMSTMSHFQAPGVPETYHSVPHGAVIHRLSVPVIAKATLSSDMSDSVELQVISDAVPERALSADDRVQLEDSQSAQLNESSLAPVDRGFGAWSFVRINSISVQFWEHSV